LNLTILDVAIIASIIAGFFLSISLITTSFYKNRPNKYLSLSLFLITILTFINWSSIDNIVLQFLNNIRLDLLAATTLFTYFLIQIQHNYLKKSWRKLLYLPFIIAVFFEILISFFAFVLGYYSENFDAIIFYSKLFTSMGFNLVLIFLARKFVKVSTSISEDKKRWLLRLNHIIMIIIIIWILSYLEFFISDSEYINLFLLVLLSFLFWWVLYYGIFRLQIIVQKDEMHQYLLSKKTNTTEKRKRISETTSSKIISNLYKLMEEEELYKNPLLSRLDLANKLEISEGYLSQIINQEINKNVIQFINEHRIETAKKLLHNPVFNKYSIEAIGLEAGFKSKSTFYNAFRTSLEMSPGAFRKLQKTS